MDRDTYDKLVAEAHAVYNRRVDAAELELREAIRRIDELAKMLARGPEHLPRPQVDRPGESSEPKRKVKRGDLSNAISLAIGRISGDFGMPDILAMIKESNPELVASTSSSSITSYLKRLAQKGIIDLVQEGKGRRPSRYRKTQRPQEKDLLQMTA